MCALCSEIREPINYKLVPVWAILKFLNEINFYLRKCIILRKEWFQAAPGLFYCIVTYDSKYYGIKTTEFVLDQYS